MWKADLSKPMTLYQGTLFDLNILVLQIGAILANQCVYLKNRAGGGGESYHFQHIQSWLMGETFMI